MDGLAFPYNWASRYCNIKKIFMSVYKPKYHRFTPKIEDMLEILGMEMRGDLHRCGIRTIALEFGINHILAEKTTRGIFAASRSDSSKMARKSGRTKCSSRTSTTAALR